jgi:hypothetical protein
MWGHVLTRVYNFFLVSMWPQKHYSLQAASSPRITRAAATVAFQSCCARTLLDSSHQFDVTLASFAVVTILLLLMFFGS